MSEQCSAERLLLGLQAAIMECLFVDFPKGYAVHVQTDRDGGRIVAHVDRVKNRGSRSVPRDYDGATVCCGNCGSDVTFDMHVLPTSRGVVPLCGVCRESFQRFHDGMHEADREWGTAIRGILTEKIVRPEGEG